MRVLVVEDDSLLSQGLTRVLTRAGHSVDRAETGLQADKALRVASYGLVVLDIGLPDIDGFEVLRRLRLRHSATNVLVWSARARGGSRSLPVRCPSAGSQSTWKRRVCAATAR